MQDPFGFSNHSFHKPKPKPPRKQVGLLQPKVLSQIDSIAKPVLPKVAKRSKKIIEETHRPHYMNEAHNTASVAAAAATPAPRSVVDMMQVTEGDCRSLYRALKRKYMTLQEESFRLAEELERTDCEVKQLEEEKFSLLDELLVLEGLAYNPYPPVQSQPRNPVNFPPR